MDISEGMVTEYSTRMQRDGITADGVVGNLLAEDVDAALGAYKGYDVAAVGLGFHHFSDSERCLRRLADRVTEGGVVLILDWLPSSGGGHGHGHGHGEEGGKDGEDEFKHMRHTIAHNGFDEDGMRELYQRAGLSAFKFVEMAEPVTLVMAEREVKKMPFLARGHVLSR